MAKTHKTIISLDFPATRLRVCIEGTDLMNSKRRDLCREVSLNHPWIPEVKSASYGRCIGPQFSPSTSKSQSPQPQLGNFIAVCTCYSETFQAVKSSVGLLSSFQTVSHSHGSPSYLLYLSIPFLGFAPTFSNPLHLSPLAPQEYYSCGPPSSSSLANLHIPTAPVPCPTIASQV